MSFGAFNHHRQPGPMADINVTPMVDVMLVQIGRASCRERV